MSVQQPFFCPNNMVPGLWLKQTHAYYNDVTMSAIASQITSLAIVYSTVYPGTDEGIYQSSASLDFVRGIHRWPVNSLHKWPVTRKMVPFDDVIMSYAVCRSHTCWRTWLIDFNIIQLIWKRLSFALFCFSYTIVARKFVWSIYLCFPRCFPDADNRRYHPCLTWLFYLHWSYHILAPVPGT